MIVQGLNSHDLTYVSSSRAAMITGYNRDYIGQLCRMSTIECKRVAGEWRVYLPSILAHKKRFGIVNIPNSDNLNNVSGTVSVSELHGTKGEMADIIDDKFIPSQLASKLTGYSQDYIGQLARSGAVKAKKVGRKWFVDENSLIEHKRRNDELLASVQAESVGVKRNFTHKNQDDDNNVQINKTRSNALLKVKYMKDDGCLFPNPVKHNTGKGARDVSEAHHGNGLSEHYSYNRRNRELVHKKTFPAKDRSGHFGSEQFYVRDINGTECDLPLFNLQMAEYMALIVCFISAVLIGLSLFLPNLVEEYGNFILDSEFAVDLFSIF